MKAFWKGKAFPSLQPPLAFSANPSGLDFVAFFYILTETKNDF